jgi:hypothetical protein
MKAAQNGVEMSPPGIVIKAGQPARLAWTTPRTAHTAAATSAGVTASRIAPAR